MSRNNWLAGGLLILASGAVAIACGPFFPWQLLDNRVQTLKATPVNSFTFEAARLAPKPADNLKAVELIDSYSPDEDRATQLGEAESADLTKTDVALLLAARGAANGGEAYIKGEGLPEDVRHYTAGAVAYRKADAAGAKPHFEAVLALPEKARTARAVWASYMLGRIAAETGDMAAAAAAFAKTRKLAVKGAHDPLGLAVASYGEEARLHLKAAQALLEAAGNTVTSDSDTGDTETAKFAGSVLTDRHASAFRTEIAKTVTLYAEQAARGSNSGVQSLRIVAEFLLGRADRIEAVAGDPPTQKLMLAYVLKRLDNNTIHITQWWIEDTGKPGTSDAGLDAQLPVLIEALKKHPHPAGADRLAALCYNLGNWNCAATFAAKTQSPQAAWVEAKLALQKGDLKGAAGFYAKAARGFPAADALEDGSKAHLTGESGVLALVRGDYVDALDKLWSQGGTYWSDVSYVAERVLTVDELKTFVDAKAPPGKPKNANGNREFYGDTESYTNYRAALRDLLARRLMREHRHDEALGYFGDSKVRENAKAYGAAMQDYIDKWGKVDRAEALFKAATIARQNGLEILGTEGPPDYYYNRGYFDTGIGRNEATGPLVTPGETKRVALSRPQDPHRFHYRYLAANAANNAANLVPARSQAFAAMLCHAAKWASRDPDRATQIWRRYVKEGARVPFATSFGAKCPVPDFEAARKMERALMWREVRRYVSRHRWWFLAGGLLAIGGLTLASWSVIRRIRRWRGKNATPAVKETT